ncbi:MAG: V-type ATPase 116kDa subunit family protein, partial [Sulfurimonadaceae bacterium]
KMLRVKIVIEPQYSDAVLETIGKKGLLHIDKKEHRLKSEAEVNRVNTLLSLAQKYMTLLGIAPKKQAITSISDLESLLDQTENSLLTMGMKVDEIDLRLREAKQESERFDKAVAAKAALAPVLDAEKISKNLNYIKMCVAMITMEATELLRISMKQKGLLLLDQPLFEQTNVVAVFYEEEDERAVSRALSTFKAVEIDSEYLTDEAFRSYQEAQKQLQHDKMILADKFREQLQEIENRLYAMTELEKAKSALQESDDKLVLEGWIPQKNAKEFVTGLEHATVTFEPFEGEAPVMLDTPPAFKPFEKLISSFAYPRYGEINPVIPFALSFLLLFGIMFGDVGHGLILALIGWIVKRYYPKYADFGQIYYLSGLSSTFFGFLFGSIFGVHDLLPHLLFTPIENIEATIAFSIGVGVAIITFSFFLHIVTAIKRKEPTLLFVSEGSILWLLVYWFTIGIFVKSLVKQMDVTYEVMVVGVLLTVIFIQMLRKKREKAQAVIDLVREFMDTITNTISFLRVGAFALAHGALFMAVFSIAEIISESQGESFFYWLSIIVGNSVIIVLEGVVVTIQTLRLEYYEFFKRFFKGGGLPYRPYILGEKNAD